MPHVPGGVPVRGVRLVDEWLGVDDAWLDLGFNPRCPDDGTVMRDVDGGWECGTCKRFETFAQGPLSPEFRGPHLPGA
jgi:hypothetical protein